jgi:CRP/FNR family transcriptional regulator
LTHEEIAAYIGSAREVVSRMLKYFESEGYIILFRKRITIKEKNKLKEILKS